jgi:hypothetical protein
MRQPFTDARYDSISDFISAVEQPCANAKNTSLHSGFLDRPSYDATWLGADCATGRDVLKLVRDGWPQGRERINALRSKIATVEAQPVDKRRRMQRGPQGDVLDMPYVWSGRLDIAWRAPRRISSQGPQRIDIVANMICSGHEHADVLFWRGAAAVVLADLLEQAGYMVRLVVIFGGNAEDKKTSCRITVKDHGVPLDITSTSAVILPGFFRALGHAWIANHAPHHRDYGGISVGQGIVDKGEILLSHNVRDHGTAVATINATIARINEGQEAAA